MPTYLTALNGVSLSEAMAEAAAVAPISRAMLLALELDHSTMAEPLRVVASDTNIEASPAVGDAAVTWLAMPIGVHLPPESDDAPVPQLQIWIDGVSGVLAGQIEAATQTLDPITLTAYLFASDDFSGPAINPPTRAELRQVSVSETRVTAVAVARDLSNTRFPRKAFSRAEHPGLVL